MDTYEALLASMNYLVKPTRAKGPSVQPKSHQVASPSSSEIGKCYFEEVTPQNWSNSPSSISKEN